MGVVSASASAGRDGARDDPQRQATSRPVPLCLRHKSLRYIIDHVAFLSLRWSEWARACYAEQRARGHSYRQALRALSAKWLKIIFVMWERRVPYDEQYHLAMMTRQQLHQRQKKVA